MKISLEYAVGGIIILLVSIRLLIAGIGATGMTSLTISSADSGKVSVGKSAIEDYVAEIAKEVYGVYGVKVEAKMGEEHISIRINASIEPGYGDQGHRSVLQADQSERLRR